MGEMPTDPPGLLRPILHMLGAQTARMIVQAAYFVLLARVIGPVGYGLFAAAIALAAIVAPFSSLGTNILMIRSVSRDSGENASQWYRAALYTVCGGTLFSFLIALMSSYLLPDGLVSVQVFFIIMADLIGLKLIETAGAYWQSRGNARPLLIWPVILNILRLIAIGTVEFLGDASISVWSAAYFLSSVPFAICVSVWTSRRVRRDGVRLGIGLDELRDGLVFSVGLSSQTIYNDIDKAMLARIGSPEAGGVYSAAYRLIDMAYVPVRAISATTYPRFFRAGSRGIRGALTLVRRVAPLTLGYSILAAGAVTLAAPWAVLVLGPGFDGVEAVLPWLSLVLLTRGASYLAGDALSGADLFRSRTVIQIGIALANVGLNLVLLPRFGIWGAVASTLACEVALASGLWIVVACAFRQEKDNG